MIRAPFGNVFAVRQEVRRADDGDVRLHWLLVVALEVAPVRFTSAQASQRDIASRSAGLPSWSCGLPFILLSSFFAYLNYCYIHL
jgi:hypothetical protein